MVKLHVVTILSTVPLGAVQLALPKGTPLHRSLGYLFVALMLATVTCSFFIREPGGGFAFSHLFIPAITIMLALGIWCAMRGNIVGHQRWMTAVYIGAVFGGGGFAFTPGHFLYRTFFGG
ncbi:MAG: DUF2306 domain-containing protein [Alphaproteobacteria bacterium]